MSGVSPKTGLPTRTPLLAETHTYDRSSNRLTTYDARPGAGLAFRDSEYDYDGLDRLIEARRGVRGTSMWTPGPGSQDWVLDMLGNWLETRRDLAGSGYGTPEEREHNEANEIVTRYPNGSAGTPVLPFTHDHAGNLRQAKRSSSTTDIYTHDAWNRLVKHQTQGSVGGPVDSAEYEYNGLHWRTAKRIIQHGSPTTHVEWRFYYSAAWQLLQEDRKWSESSTVDEYAQQVWGLRYIDDAVMRRRFSENLEEWDPGLYHYITDAQFSTVAIIGTGADPRVMERVRYEAYGRGTHRFPGDFSGDRFVDSADEQMLFDAWGQGIGDPGYNADIDLNRDGVINGDDLLEFGLWENRVPMPVGFISDPIGPDNSIGYAGYTCSRCRCSCTASGSGGTRRFWDGGCRGTRRGQLTE
jgi:hypothetical protein